MQNAYYNDTYKIIAMIVTWIYELKNYLCLKINRNKNITNEVKNLYYHKIKSDIKRRNKNVTNGI